MLYYSIEMPRRAFDPTVMPTQRLTQLAHQLADEVVECERECTKRFANWCKVGIMAPQGEQDIAQGACRNARRNRTRAFNKRTAVMEEIMNRDRQELRAMEDQWRNGR